MGFNFAIIGCGRIAKKHAAIITEFGQLVACIDTNDQVKKAFANVYHSAHFSSIQDCIASGIKVDILVVCSPNGLHAQHVVCGLENGWHVIVEKPVTLSVSDIERIQAAEKKLGKTVFPVMQNRFNPVLQAIHRHILANSFGCIHSFQINCLWSRSNSYYNNSWHGSKALDGGILFTQVSHFIDLLTWNFGECIDAHGYTANQSHKTIEIEDTGVFILRFSKNIVGTVHCSVNTVPSNVEGSFALHTDAGSIKIGGKYLSSIEYNTTAIQLPKIQEVNNHLEVYKNLLATLLEDKTCYTNLEEAKITIATIEKMYNKVNNDF